MKRLLLVMLSLLLICGNALAIDEAALINPKDRYQIYFEETDGSEYTTYVMLDAMNDEASIIEEHGALTVKMTTVGVGGRQGSTSYTVLQNSDYGPMIITSTSEDLKALTAYQLSSHSYSTFFNMLMSADELEYEDFGWYWESFYFPFGNLETLNGIRQDEEGNTYFLIKSDDIMSFEFAAGSGMKIEELRVYERNADGDDALTMLVHWEAGPAKELPECVLTAMAEDFKK